MCMTEQKAKTKIAKSNRRAGDLSLKKFWFQQNPIYLRDIRNRRTKYFSREKKQEKKANNRWDAEANEIVDVNVCETLNNNNSFKRFINNNCYLIYIFFRGKHPLERIKNLFRLNVSEIRCVIIFVVRIFNNYAYSAYEARLINALIRL